MLEVLLVVGLVWLLALTIAFLGVTRYVGAIQATAAGGQAPDGGWLFDTDGPWVPSPLPSRASGAFRGFDIQTDDLTATFFSSRCGSCLERAEDVARAMTDPTRNVFLVTGIDPDPEGGVSRILATTGAPIIVDPDAHDIVKSMDINSTPFTFRVIDGQVVSKAFIRDLDDYLRVVNEAFPPLVTDSASKQLLPAVSQDETGNNKNGHD